MLSQELLRPILFLWFRDSVQCPLTAELPGTDNSLSVEGEIDLGVTRSGGPKITRKPSPPILMLDVGDNLTIDLLNKGKTKD